MKNTMALRIFGMYVINLLVIISINVRYQQNIATYLLQKCNVNAGLKIPNLWLALMVLGLYVIVNLRLDKNAVNGALNRLRIVMLVLILVSVISEFIR